MISFHGYRGNNRLLLVALLVLSIKKHIWVVFDIGGGDGVVAAVAILVNSLISRLKQSSITFDSFLLSNIFLPIQLFMSCVDCAKHVCSIPFNTLTTCMLLLTESFSVILAVMLNQSHWQPTKTGTH